MRRTRSIVGLVAVLLALSTLATAGVVVTQSDGDAVEVSLEEVEAAPGETVTVTLSTANVDDLAGYEATVAYDTSVVQLESVEGVDLSDPLTNVDEDAGEVTMTQSAPEAVDGNPNPVLAELTFTVVGEAGDETALELRPDAVNVNSPTENLPTTTVDGSVSVPGDDGGDGDDGNGEDGDGSDGDDSDDGDGDDGTDDPDDGPVHVSLEDEAAAPDETVEVRLRTSGVDDLAGYEAVLDYDPTVVQLEDVSGVDLPDPVGNVDDDAGTASLTQSTPQAVDGNPDPVLAELTFAVVGEPGDETTLELDADELNVNSPTQNYPSTPSDGSVTVVANDGGDGGADDGADGDEGNGDDGTDVGGGTGGQAGGDGDAGTGEGSDGTDAVGDGSVATDSTVVGVSIADVEATAGETVNVTLTTTNADELAGYEAVVNFDPAVVRLEDTAAADFDDPIADVDNDAGSVRVTQAGPEAVDGNPNPELATLTFEVVGDVGDSTALEFEPSAVNVNDEDAVLSTTLSAGSLAVVAEGGSDAGDGGTGDAVVVSLADVEAEPDETVDVALTTSNVADLAGYEASLSYDPDVLRVEDVQGVDLSDPIVNVDEKAGTVSMTQSAPEAVEANPNPVLATVTFAVVGDSGASSALELDADELNVNSPTQNYPSTPSDGSVTVVDSGSTDGSDGAEGSDGTGASDGDAVVVSLADVEAEGDGTVTVALSTSNVADLAGYEATIDYDPSVLRLETVNGVGLRDPVTSVDNEAGTVSMTQSAPEAVEANPNPVLAKLTFTVVGEPGDASPLSIDADELNVNSEVENLPTAPDDGSVTIVAELSNESESNETAADGGSGDGGVDDSDDSADGDGQPGFTAVGAVGSLIVLLLAAVARTKLRPS